MAAFPPPLAERRQLTVMFVDLVASTALGARLDPEDLRDVIAAYDGTVTGLVARFDGFVARYMGDGVLVYFGYPRAHEDDAERAIRAGLTIVDAVSKLATIAGPAGTLSARVGIASGTVVVVILSVPVPPVNLRWWAIRQILRRAFKRRPRPVQSSFPMPYGALREVCSSIAS